MRPPQGPEGEPQPEVESPEAGLDDQAASDPEEPAPSPARPGKKAVAAVLAAAVFVLAVWGGRSFVQTSRRETVPAGSRDWAWQKLAFPPIEPRYGHAAVWTGSAMIVWGGFSGIVGPSADAGIRADGAQFSPRSGRWEVIPAAPIPHRPDMPAVWTGREMIAGGGDPAQPARTAALDPAAKIWRELAPAPLPLRGGQSAVWSGAEMILWGGRVSDPGRPEEPVLSAAGAALNPATNAWAPIPDAPIAAREGHSAVWSGTEMIVWGGVGSTGAQARQTTFFDGAAYDPAARSWRQLSSPPLQVQGPAVWSGDQMLVWGVGITVPQQASSPAGVAGSPSPRPPGGLQLAMHPLAYNPATDRWRRLPDPPLAARTEATAVWSAGRLLVWGGFNRANPQGPLYGPAADGAAYHPASNRWEKLPAAPIRGRNFGFSAVPSARGMIVWGGKRPSPASGAFADGAELLRRP